jgi:hypothetical protein
VRVKRRETVPERRTLAIVPRCGPAEMRTLCGRLPDQRKRTVSPRLMLSDLVPNRFCGPTRTVFVAASAGTAIAAQRTTTAASTAMRRLRVMRERGLLSQGGK